MEVKCGDCDLKIKAFVRGRQGKLLERKYCRECFLKSHKSRKNLNKANEKEKENIEEAASVMRIGGMEIKVTKKKRRTAVILDHHIFDTGSCTWKRSNSMPQPLVRLCLGTEPRDYEQFDLDPPQISESFVNGVADTGAQSCLMGTKMFYQCGFQKKDLIPVKCKMAAANREPLNIPGAILVRLCPAEGNINVHTGAMVYISPDTDKFYLSHEALKDLKIIDGQFPIIPDEINVSSISSNPSTCSSVIASKVFSNGSLAPCGCLTRTKPPARPERLPFQCHEKNGSLMRQWLLDRYKSSTFNKCSH